jgi:hypothetical protein
MSAHKRQRYQRTILPSRPPKEVGPPGSSKYSVSARSRISLRSEILDGNLYDVLGARRTGKVTRVV